MEGVLEKLSTMFEDAAVEATKNYQGKSDTETLDKIKNSIPNLPKASKDILFKKGRDYSIATTFDSIRHIVDGKSLDRYDVINYLDKLADTVLDFDSVTFNYYEKGKDKLPGLLFKKNFADGALVSFDLVSHKKRSLVLQTLYMDSADYQKKKSAKTLLMQNANSNTSETQAGQTSTNIVSQDSDSVKRKFSERNPDSVSNRSLLANALEGVAQNDIEKNKLAQYKEKISHIESEQEKLSQLKAKIKELSFAKGPRDTKQIRELQDEATKTANRINIYDRQLLNLEATTALKNVLEREKARVRNIFS